MDVVANDADDDDDGGGGGGGGGDDDDDDDNGLGFVPGRERRGLIITSLTKMRCHRFLFQLVIVGPCFYFVSVHYLSDTGVSVGSVWARCPQRRGFDPPLGTFSGRGDFSLGVNMGSNSIPPKTLSDESINRGLVRARMHFIARTQKMLTFMS